MNVSHFKQNKSIWGGSIRPEGGFMEIEIRAWDKENNFMWYSGQEGASIGDYTFYTYFDPSTHCLKAISVKSVDVGFIQTTDTEYQLPIMQSAPFKSNDGQKLYKSDIVRTKNILYNNWEFITGTINFVDGCWVLEFSPCWDVGSKCNRTSAYLKLFDKRIGNYGMDKIGDIYGNLEVIP